MPTLISPFLSPPPLLTSFAKNCDGRPGSRSVVVAAAAPLRLRRERTREARRRRGLLLGVSTAPSEEPKELTLGQLAKDGSVFSRMLNGEREPLAHGLVWLAAILHRVGEKAVGWDPLRHAVVHTQFPATVRCSVRPRARVGMSRVPELPPGEWPRH